MRWTHLTIVLTLFASALPAAPVPQGAGKADEPADLKGLHALIGKSVETGKWPTADEEKKVKATIQKLRDRITKASELKERKISVDWAAIEKADIAKDLQQVSVDKAFVLAGSVQGTSAANSVIFASGDVQFTSISNCIVVGKNVRFTVVQNSLIVAEEFLRGTSAGRRGNEDDGSTLVAGEWLRLTGATGTIGHVLRPGGKPSPDDRGNGPFKAIRMTVAENVMFLNSPEDVGLTSNKNNTMKAQTTLIAK